MIYERLGTEQEILERSKGEDISIWIKNYIKELNQKIKEDSLPILIKKLPNSLIPKDEQNLFNCGYLFLEKLYYELGLNQICETISNKYKFEYDLNNILSRLLYGRIIFPASKLATQELSKKFIEQPIFELHHIYRALEVISKENEFIQSELTNDSKSYNISDIDKNEELYKDKIFYKKRWIKENGLEQKLIVTYSIKYRNYQRQIRNSQIERAKYAIKNNSVKLDKCNQNDYKRFVNKTNITNEGEIAENKILSLNTEQIEKEEKFDGFYGVCTNLEDNAEEIIKVNQ